MKTLTLNNEITTAANNVIRYSRGYYNQNTDKLIRPATKFINNSSYTNRQPATFKTVITFARCRLFTILLQAIEIFYIVYK